LLKFCNKAAKHVVGLLTSGEINSNYEQ
jgi:hypothetical protein